MDRFRCSKQTSHPPIPFLCIRLAINAHRAARVTQIIVDGCGAGGGGACGASGAGNGNGGGGGAAVVGQKITVVPGSSYTITIGTGGAEEHQVQQLEEPEEHHLLTRFFPYLVVQAHPELSPVPQVVMVV